MISMLRNKATSRWKDRLDVDAMARFFIIQEVMDNPDEASTETLTYKDQGEVASGWQVPIWTLPA